MSYENVSFAETAKKNGALILWLWHSWAISLTHPVLATGVMNPHYLCPHTPRLIKLPSNKMMEKNTSSKFRMWRGLWRGYPSKLTGTFGNVHHFKTYQKEILFLELYCHNLPWASFMNLFWELDNKNCQFCSNLI